MPQPLPRDQNIYIRARGYHRSGAWNGSGSVIEAVKLVYLPSNGFTDDPIVPGVTVVRAIHITEIRARIDALRGRYGLAPFAYSEPGVFVFGTVLATHLTEMRLALSQVYSAVGLPLPDYSDPTLVGDAIKAVHINELRSFVSAIE
jgi:hypothetical protein